MKKGFIFLVMAFVLFGGLAFRYGRPWYWGVRDRRTMTQARQFLRKGDSPNALVALRQALQINPNNLEACQVMAECAEASRSPFALAWRRRVAELAPTLTNRLILAACALRFEAPPFALAENVLWEIGASFNVACHILAAELAIKLTRLPDAERHLLEASRLEPGNRSHQVNLAVLQLLSKDPRIAAQARGRLEEARLDPDLAMPILRSLVTDSRARQQLDAAERFARDLVTITNSTFRDRLLHLSILREKQSPQFATLLQSVQLVAATNAVTSAELCGWMCGADLAGEAVAWVKSLPATLQSQQPLPVAVAQCDIARRDWTGLEAHVQPQQWGEMEFMRLAWLARARDSQKDKSGQRVYWQKAVRLAGEDPVMTSVLAALAEEWGWKLETEELLWSVLNAHPREVWAAPALERLYYASGNTHGLQKVWARMLNRTPTDPVLKNNLAMCSFLLKTDIATGQASARDLYRLDPKQPGYASTYAFSLVLQGKASAALEVLESLPREDLESPSTAAYYGIVLSAAGQPGSAQRYLALADKAPLLPEEKELLERAKRQ